MVQQSKAKPMSEKYRRIGQDAWVEMPAPLDGDNEAVDAYNNRTHHPIENPDSWWKEGEVKELDKDFIIVDDDNGGRLIEPRKVVIPINWKPQPTTKQKPL